MSDEQAFAELVAPYRRELHLHCYRMLGSVTDADDVDALVTLLTDDAWLVMPPAPHEYHGVGAITAFLRASAAGRDGQRIGLLPTRANTQPAFACHLGPRPSGLVVLTLSGGCVAGIIRFLDPALPSMFGSRPGREPADLGWEP